MFLFFKFLDCVEYDSERSLKVVSLHETPELIVSVHQDLGSFQSKEIAGAVIDITQLKSGQENRVVAHCLPADVSGDHEVQPIYVDLSLTYTIFA